jgi:diketogulonate reductase-like aldo/keto reductase
VPREKLFITTKIWSNHLRYRDVPTALKGSLKRLGIESVDLYLIHWPNESVPLRDTFKALNELVEAGNIKMVGGSNFSLKQLKQAQKLSRTPIATNQVRYNLFDRRSEQDGMLEYCQRSGIILTAYEPLGKGGLLGHQKLQELSERQGVSPAQLAIHWLVKKPGVITIPMSSKLEHLKENLAAADLELSSEDYRSLEVLS